MLFRSADRDVLGSGREVTFFGERTRLPAGPVELALRTGAALVPTYVLRTRRERVRLIVEEPLVLPSTGEREADVTSGHRVLAEALERGIRRAPGQWLPLEPVWRGLPY